MPFDVCPMTELASRLPANYTASSSSRSITDSATAQTAVTGAKMAAPRDIVAGKPPVILGKHQRAHASLRFLPASIALPVMNPVQNVGS